MALSYNNHKIFCKFGPGLSFWVTSSIFKGNKITHFCWDS